MSDLTDEQARAIRQHIIDVFREMDAVRRLGDTHPLIQKMIDEHNFDISKDIPKIIENLETGNWDDEL